MAAEDAPTITVRPITVRPLDESTDGAPPAAG